MLKIGVGDGIMTSLDFYLKNWAKKFNAGWKWNEP